MNVINDLLKTLIKKKNNLRPKSFEYQKTFLKCKNILSNFHPLEINQNSVQDYIIDLCYKLELHCLFVKAERVRKLCEKVIGLKNIAPETEETRMRHGILLFLLEIHCSSIKGGCEDDIDESITLEDLNDKHIDWGQILRHSDDILELTRLNYDSDSLSQTSSDSFQESSSPTETQPKISVISEPIQCPQYFYPDLEQLCSDSLQSEYWLGDSCKKKSKFLHKIESFLSEKRSDYYYSDVKNRVIMTDYQWMREVLDVLQGARTCTIWNNYRDSLNIANNYYSVSKNCKLSNISCGAFDNISSTMACLATHGLHLRLASDNITGHNDLLSISPPIIAFGEQFHDILDEFYNEVRSWENKVRGNVSLSIFELENMSSIWLIRLTFIDDILMCVTSGRLEALHYHSTVVTLLDLLYRLMNESCIMAIDTWTISFIHKIFFHTFRPYLFSLDALLCGQTHLSSTNLFLAPNELALSFTDINDYFYNHFTIKKTASQSIISTIPVVLHPFVVKLVSTIKSIDLLRLLSIELTKPGIVNTIVKIPGSFINHFNIDSEDSNDDWVQIMHLEVINKRVHDNALFNHISNKLINSCTRQCQIRKVRLPLTNSTVDLVESCRLLHHNLLSDISDRHSSVNNHLINVYIDYLGLDKSLKVLKSVYFLQAGVEMYDFTRQLFMLLVEHRSISELNLYSNLKLHQVMSESVDIHLQQETSKLIVKVSLDNVVPISSEQSRMIAILSSAITIDYKVPWGLSLIINDNTLEICNRCFRFLLQLRFSKHCLEFAIQTERNNILRHKLITPSIDLNRMRALRLKLLQIINSFHIYIMNTFIVPAWFNIDKMITIGRASFQDFTDFIHRISEPFNVMARGCLQIEELAKFRKAIDLVISLAVNASQVNGTQCSQALLEQLETEHRRLMDFISAMFKGLYNMGISINGLDMGAFK